MKFIAIRKCIFDIDPTPIVYGPIEADNELAALGMLDASSLEVGDDEELELFLLNPLPL